MTPPSTQSPASTGAKSSEALVDELAELLALCAQSLRTQHAVIRGHNKAYPDRPLSLIVADEADSMSTRLRNGTDRKRIKRLAIGP